MWGKGKEALKALGGKVTLLREQMTAVERTVGDVRDDLGHRLGRLEELISKAPEVARKNAGVPVVITTSVARDLERQALKRIDLGGTDMLVNCYSLIALLRSFLITHGKIRKEPLYDEPTEETS